MIELNTRSYELKYHKGAVRWITCNGTEIIRMIYSAVRDRNWGTVEPEIVSENIVKDEQGFRIDVRAVYLQNDIHYEADYRITGKENRLLFEMTGEAKSTFLTNRTGICILHPIRECIGKYCRIEHSDGTAGSVFFPEDISPWQPMKNISAMEWQPADNITARLRFEGEEFEMEDQRNWTDASYKTYCRPLDLPFPFEIRQGDKVWQKVELEILPETIIHEKPKNVVTFSIDKSRCYPLPKIGVCSTSRKETLTKKEAVVLQAFPFDHLRVEIKLFMNNWKLEWVRAAGESLRLNVPLFAILYFSDNIKAELMAFIEAVLRTGVQVKFFLILGRDHLSDDKFFNEVYDELKEQFPKALVGAGVNAYFAELNRSRPKIRKADFISFAVSPQVHAFDNNTLIENLEGQMHVVESARKLYPDKPVFVSPVTFKQRFNVVATSKEPELSPGELPPQVDIRQCSTFAALWLAASLKFLAHAGAGLVTYFESVGWRGFVQGEYNSPMPDKFPASKGNIFPEFHLLKELKGFDEVIHSSGSSPLRVEGMLLRNSFTGEGKLVVLNFDSERHDVRIEGIEVPEEHRLLFTAQDAQVKDEYVSVPPGAMVIFPVNLS